MVREMAGGTDRQILGTDKGITVERREGRWVCECVGGCGKDLGEVWERLPSKKRFLKKNQATKKRTSLFGLLTPPPQKAAIFA